MKLRSGFTLLEMLVTVSIIAILVGLLLPAIQSVREMARLAHCAHNLRQLGLAMGSYVSTHSVFPPGVVNDTGPIKNLPTGYHHGWVVQILPFMGQSNLYHHLDLKKSVYDPVNDTVAGIKIETLLCPSNSGPGVVDYAGCHHDAAAPIAADNRGVLYLNSKVRYDEITDGPAYTILLGEIPGEPLTLGWISGTRSTLRNTGTPLKDQDWPSGPASTVAPIASTTPRDEVFAIVEQEVAGGSWPVDLTGGFASDHTLACNFLLCDGSVRSIKKTIDERVYRLLGSRADGEPISSDAY